MQFWVNGQLYFRSCALFYLRVKIHGLHRFEKFSVLIFKLKEFMTFAAEELLFEVGRLNFDFFCYCWGASTKSFCHA